MHRPRMRGLAVLAGVWLRDTETEISATQFEIQLGKDFAFLQTIVEVQYTIGDVVILVSCASLFFSKITVKGHAS